MVDARPPLLGRETECEELERLIAGVRGGQSRVLVLAGEAGVGKTALLEHLAASAEGCRLARTAGVESEMELPFAGLYGVCAPFLHRLRDLPPPQSDALSTAFGMSDGAAPDRFLVGLAVLTLLADVAEEQPLLCIVDDAQWLDRVSAQTLAFVARRLLAERVGLVFAERETEPDALNGLPRLDLEGLSATDSAALLDATIPGPLDQRVRARILTEAGGNPLALLELPRGLTPVTVAGGFGLPTTLTLTSRMEQGFTRRLKPLPAETRRLLLLAAAEPVGDAFLLRSAAERLGIAPDAQEPAEAAGLIEVAAGGVRFRHPLVRSAAYRGATAPERRDAHRALADATNAQLDPDRRAWHRAHAAEGPDEAVADELERSASRAQARGGIAAAAAFLERATALTPDPAQRSRRAVAAAQASFESAAPEAARELLSVAEQGPLDPLQRGRLARLRAQIAFALRPGREAPPLLLDAARALEPFDAALARETYLEALGAAMLASGVRAAAEAAKQAPSSPAPRSIDLILDGMVARFTDGPDAGVPPLRIAVQAFSAEALDGHAQTMRWLALCPVVQSLAVFELWDDAAFAALATRAVRLAREAGALTALPISLVYLAGVHLFRGEFGVASAQMQEADAITAATGNASLVYARLLLAAWRGVEAETTAIVAAALDVAQARGEGRVLALAGYGTSVLYNGLGRYEAAIEGAQRAIEDDDQGYAGPALGELVEAAIRAGRPELAAAALARLERRARAAGTDWALGLLARAQALVGNDEASYREASERLARTTMRVELARARLLYGEWLRREGRRVDAREQLRAAHEVLAQTGAEAFAERARRELVATGETVQRRTPETRDLLTPQETQIARLAADGHTNPEIGAQLFISPRTVEYHLRKVFGKLDVNSRKELATALP